MYGIHFILIFRHLMNYCCLLSGPLLLVLLFYFSKLDLATPFFLTFCSPSDSLSSVPASLSSPATPRASWARPPACLTSSWCTRTRRPPPRSRTSTRATGSTAWCRGTTGTSSSWAPVPREDHGTLRKKALWNSSLDVCSGAYRHLKTFGNRFKCAMSPS